MGLLEKRARSFKLESLGLFINPVVCILGTVVVLGIMAWSFATPSGFSSEIWYWKRRMMLGVTWLFYLLRNWWVVFLVWLYFSRYGEIVLGCDQTDTQKQYSDAAVVYLLFVPGMGLALLFFGTAEPVHHLAAAVQTSAAQQTPMSYNEASSHAMLLTLFNFGVHVWAPFVLLGLTLAWASYRKGLPMSVRSCFYPLLRDQIYGWWGDVIDVFAIVTALIGGSAALGFGAIQMSAGVYAQRSKYNFLRYQGEDIQNLEMLLFTVWCSTVLAMICTLSLRDAPRRLMEFALVFMSFMVITMYLLGDSGFVFNVYQETLGQYLFYFVKLSTHLDTFEQLDSGVDSPTGEQSLSLWFQPWFGTGWHSKRVLDDPPSSGYGPTDPNGMYWGWWMSMAPVMGLWVAKLAKGRTVRQILRCGVLYPVLLSLGWISLLGGTSLQVQRRAVIDGCRCGCEFVGPSEDANYTFDRTFCDSINLNPTGRTALSAYYESPPRTGEPLLDQPLTCMQLRPIAAKHQGGCASILPPAERRPEQRWYDILGLYEGGSRPTRKPNYVFFRGMSLTAQAALLAACADASMEVAAWLAASGAEEAHKVVRCVLLAVQATLVTALLRAGAYGPMYDAGTMLQSASIVCGLLFALVLLPLPTCLLLGLQDAKRELPRAPVRAYAGETEEKATAAGTLEASPSWTVSLFGGPLLIFESLCSAFNQEVPPSTEAIRFALSLFVPYYVLPVAFARINTEKVLGVGWAPPLFCWMAFWWWIWITMHIAELAPYRRGGKWNNPAEGWWAMAWTGYLLVVVAVAGCRYSTRSVYRIPGNVVHDFLVSLVAYPLVICQISAQEVIQGAPFDTQVSPLSAEYKPEPAAEEVQATTRSYDPASFGINTEVPSYQPTAGSEGPIPYRSSTDLGPLYRTTQSSQSAVSAAGYGVGATGPMSNHFNPPPQSFLPQQTNPRELPGGPAVLPPNAMHHNDIPMFLSQRASIDLSAVGTVGADAGVA